MERRKRGWLLSQLGSYNLVLMDKVIDFINTHRDR